MSPGNAAPAPRLAARQARPVVSRRGEFGCLTGAALGLYGQQLFDRARANVINFPVVHSVAAISAIGSLALVTAAAVAIVAIPGYLASGVPAAVALAD